MQRARDFRRLSRVFAMLGLVAIIVRIGVGWHGFDWVGFFEGAYVIGVFVVVCLPVIWVVVRVRTRNLQRLAASYPGAFVDRIATGARSAVLVITDDTIRLINRHGEIVRAWDRDQVRHAVVQRLDFGAIPKHWGLRLELGKHKTHETIDLAFPRWGGLWTSEARATNALHAIRK